MANRFLRLDWVVFVVLMAATPLLLMLRKAGNISFYSLLLLGALTAASRLRPDGRTFSSLVKEYWPLHLAMAGMSLAIFINQLVLQNFVISAYDPSSRMAFFVVLLWVVLLLPYHLIKHLQWAFVAGALLAALKMYVTTQGGEFRSYDYFIPILEFAQMAQIFGFLALLSLGCKARNKTWGKIGIGVKLLAGIAGLYTAYLSQTRGTWIGIPIFVLITLFILRPRVSIRKQITVAVTALLLVTAFFGTSNMVQQRLVQAQHDILEYFGNGNVDTSVGIRFQLWKGSWILYKEHPLVGVGQEGFSAALGDLERRQIITSAARALAHSHNEILHSMATLGTVGLIAILCLYFVPGAYFLRGVVHVDHEIRAAAGMGLILCGGFFILGLTDVMFILGPCDTFYSIVAAILFAFIIKRKKILSDAGSTCPSEALI
jgi:O-antigen ligase